MTERLPQVAGGARPPWGLAAALALAAALYLVSAAGPFQFDDHATVAVDRGAQSLAAWWDGAARHVRPLTKASFALTHALGERIGDVPAGHHLGNLAIHLAAMLMLYALGRALCASCDPRLDDAACRRAAALAAAAFGLHPLASEAVAYIGGRSMALGTLLAAASVWAWIRWRGGAGRAWLGGAIAACAGAVLARETMLVTPALWLAWEAVRGPEHRRAAQRSPDRRPPHGQSPHGQSPHGQSPSRRARVACALAMPAIAAAWLALHERYRPLLEVSAAIASRHALEPTLPTALAYFASGLALLRYPSIDPDVAPAAMTPALRTALTLALAAAIVGAWRLRRHSPHLLTGLAWVLVWIAPLYLVQVRYDALAERHFYPAIWGASFALAVAANRWAAGRAARARLVRAAAALVLGGLAVVTFARNTDYRSEVALWEAAHRSAPDKPRVLNNLGVAYMEAGRWDDAVRVLERALALDPLDGRAADNLIAARERDLGPGHTPGTALRPDLAEGVRR